jgi:hypothetical protein
MVNINIESRLDKIELKHLVDKHKNHLKRLVSRDVKPKKSYTISYTFYGDYEIKCGRLKYTSNNQTIINNWHYSATIKINDDVLKNKNWIKIIVDKLVFGIKGKIDNIAWY